MITFVEWCIKNKKESFLLQWDKTLNNGYSPDAISYGSNKRISWKCEKGHVWVSTVNNRTSSKISACPYCSGKKLLKGLNDLETLYPNIAAEWDYELNEKQPSSYFGSSNVKVNWICEKGHKYAAKINDRTKTKGTGCPYCSGNKVLKGYNDLKTIFPQIAEEWDYEKNERCIDNVSAHSGYRAWWICSNKHSYSACVVDRTKDKGTGCPYCAGKRVYEGYNDLLHLFPDIAEEWDYEKNNPLKPNMVTTGQKRKYWWKCKENHSWQATLSSRCNAKTGCPYCAGEKTIIGLNDLETNYPEIALEWNYKKNTPIKPCEVMPNSGRKYWWICKQGHEWETTPNSRISSMTGCPICSQELHTSFPEQALFFYISKYENVSNRYMLDKYELDLFLPEYQIAIEYDGIYYHSSEEAKKREQRKNDYLRKHKIKLIRIKETDGCKISNDNVIFRMLKRKEEGLDDAICEVFKTISKTNGKHYNLDINTYRDKQQIWANYLCMKKENSIQALYPEIAKEWNYNRNISLLPDQVSVGSHKKVWWRCRQGHEWETTVKNRVNGNNCPYCAGKRVLVGYNDLQTTLPHVASEWNFEKNSGSPNEYTKYSGKKVWWKCKQGHEWETAISKRAMGRNCPYCSNRKVLRGYNDLETRYPEIAKSWNYEKNDMKPWDVFPFSNTKVWWKCRCGYEWESTINYRCRGNGCPKCKNKI